eukprot:TRINITY_DN662_c0_g2_i1.p1 TRINITY_DN662_c0_g2~~TRINITY_DN662_c0_g2_i1.p1  ORF type:complete len:230 (-),score=95.05 TRINITY_DN662_c0_g2_i1:74-763(-)
MGQSGSKAGINIEVSEQQIVTSTGLTVEQVHEIHETIKTNFNQKNYLSKRRFYIIADHLSRYHPELANDDLKSIYFNLFDSDHNGKIDIQELITGLAVLSTGDSELKARLTFKAFDINNDGYLTKDEIALMIEKSIHTIKKLITNEIIGQTGDSFLSRRLAPMGASIITTATKQAMDAEIAVIVGKDRLTVEEFILLSKAHDCLSGLFDSASMVLRVAQTQAPVTITPI